MERQLAYGILYCMVCPSTLHELEYVRSQSERCVSIKDRESGHWFSDNYRTPPRPAPKPGEDGLSGEPYKARRRGHIITLLLY